MLSAGGIMAELDRQRGYDHGVFIPFLLTFEKADIPTIQISLSADLSPETHLQMGKLLAPLRKEGVLIVGSGMSYHDVSALMGRSDVSGAGEFDTWLSESMLDIKARETHLANWADAPFARACHPREEHLLPLHVVAGAAAGEKAECSYHENVMGAPISAFKFV
jgi:aromatic ring-opening dioxygenase catalytic subunit (LigB family)